MHQCVNRASNVNATGIEITSMVGTGVQCGLQQPSMLLYGERLRFPREYTYPTSSGIMPSSVSPAESTARFPIKGSGRY